METAHERGIVTKPSASFTAFLVVSAALVVAFGCSPSAGGQPTNATARATSTNVRPSVAPTQPLPTPTSSPDHLSYVALGDSLLYALEEDCDGCTSAAVLYGARVESDLRIPVEVHNLTMHNSLTSSGLLKYLEEGASIGRDPENVLLAVAGADIVSVTIGFNDFPSPPPSLTAPMERFSANLSGILARIVELRSGLPTILRVTEIYNNGGGAWQRLVEAQNKVICDLAAEHGAVCVAVYDAFNGADGTGDPDALGYLGDDRTHPSQLGMDVIAEALAASGYAPLH